MSAKCLIINPQVPKTASTMDLPGGAYFYLVPGKLALATTIDAFDTHCMKCAYPERHYITSRFHEKNRLTIENIRNFTRLLEGVYFDPDLEYREIVYYVEQNGERLSTAPLLLAFWLHVVAEMPLSASVSPFEDILRGDLCQQINGFGFDGDSERSSVRPHDPLSGGDEDPRRGAGGFSGYATQAPESSSSLSVPRMLLGRISCNAASNNDCTVMSTLPNYIRAADPIRVGKLRHMLQGQSDLPSQPRMSCRWIK